MPAYRRQQEQGTIEISTTPFYHPILPLLINSRVDDGNVPVDFHFPEDAREQLRAHAPSCKSGSAGAREACGRRRDRCRKRWPNLCRSAGFEWMATDEGILAKSGVHVYDGDRHRLYQPYRRGDVTIFFRDRNLSDLIGFHYMHGAGARQRAGSHAAVEGNSGRLARFHHSRWRESLGLLPASGRDFLRFLFDGIQKDPALEAVTLSEARGSHDAGNTGLAGAGFLGRRELRHLDGPSGRSRGLGVDRPRARGLMERKGGLLQDQWDLAYEELLVAEGSDWMWWFGNDFSSDDDAVFDALFRQHIGNIYRLMGLPQPDGLDIPIKKSLGKSGVMFRGWTEGNFELGTRESRKKIMKSQIRTRQSRFRNSEIVNLHDLGSAGLSSDFKFPSASPTASLRAP